MILGYQKIEVTSAVKTGALFTLPTGVSGAMLQAETQNVRYTMDGTTVPTAVNGMLLITGLRPEQFQVEDLLHMKFCLAAGVTGTLHLHYFGGRSI